MIGSRWVQLGQVLFIATTIADKIISDFKNSASQESEETRSNTEIIVLNIPTFLNSADASK